MTNDLGILLKPKDEEELIRLMLGFANEEYNFDSNNIRRYAIKSFSKDSIANQFDLIYRNSNL